MSDRTVALHMKNGAVWVAIASLVVALLMPILTAQRVNAAQILERYIEMQSSAESVETDYNFSFQLGNGATLGALRVEFCNESPLPGLACNGSTVESDNVPDLDADAGAAITLSNWAIAATAGSTTDAAANCTTANATLATTHTAGSNLNYFDIACGVGNAETIGVNDYVNFTINDINNPSNTTDTANNNPFYARIYTYTDPVAANLPAYAAGGNTLGEYEGGVALSTAEQITVSARVQEVLTFTVGVDAAADNCAAIAGSAVDLGVLTTTQTNQASVDGVAATPNTDVACAEITTNAANGVNVHYVGDNLAVGSTVCADADTDKATNDLVTDQCINRVADGTVATGSPIANGDEQWGIGIVDAPHSVGTGTTSNMSVETAYDALTNDEWSFVPNAVTLIASSTTVVDQEALEIDMAATPSITTPTGVYDTTLTFIATATF